VETFTSPQGQIGAVGYNIAAAWVHTKLDHKFYVETGFKGELDDIAKELEIAPQALMLLGDLATDLLPRKLGGTITAQIGMVSQGVDAFKKGESDGVSKAALETAEKFNTTLEATSASFDIAGLLLIIPSILEARKAHKIRLEVNELRKQSADASKKTGDKQKELKNKYNNYYNKKRPEKVQEKLKSLDFKFETYQGMDAFGVYLNKTEKALMSRKTLAEKEGNNRRINGINNKINEIKEMRKLAQDLVRMNEETRQLSKETKTLAKNMLIKITASSTGIITSLAAGSKAVITLNQIATGTVNLTATTASAALGLFGGPLVVGSAAAQLVADSLVLDKNVRRKKVLRRTIKNLLARKDSDGKDILNNTEKELLKNIKHLEMRNINRKLISMSMGVTADVAGIAVGTVATVSVIVGAATMGVGVVAVPIIAGVAVGAKIGADAYMKWQDDKEQKEYMEKSPELSDIGIVARLRETIESRDKQPGAAAIAEDLLRHYYGMDPEVFVHVTAELEGKYQDLQLQKQRREVNATLTKKP